MISLATYLPEDRCQALAHGASLADHTHGTALFADISGFTLLTEHLTHQFGTRRGVEALTQRINAVYDALVGCIEQQCGSVISFAGDAITCWFEETSTGPQQPTAVQGQQSARSAVAAAFAMQERMQAFPGLAVKIVVSSGPARRCVVGDPAVQLIDTLAGKTIARLATGEHLAHQGGTLLDVQTAALCVAAGLSIIEWREDITTHERFALVTTSTPFNQGVAPQNQVEDVPVEALRAFILPTVYAREQSGQGEFLTELRPSVALFLRFSGIDYDGDEAAPAKLDRFTRQVQTVVARHDGNLLQLIIGDKGSVVYICFGAPVAHEDDARRAVRAALELREIPGLEIQIGITQGIMRVGAYGGTTRRTYSAIGDDVNLAARLMQTAAPSEILVSRAVQQPGYPGL